MTERTYTALIVDDEPLARALVREHLATHTEVQVLAECSDGFEAVRAAAEARPDLLFLDIQMPKLTGFEVHAVDYLLKPFSEERFEAALALAKTRCGAGPGPDPAALAGTASEGRTLERLVVKDGTKVTLVPMAKIDYLQAQDDYVLIKTAEREHLKTQTLSSLEERLDPQRFVRIHRSYIIQLDRLARLEQSPRESWTAVLANGARLPVSRSGYARLREVLGE
jgi:two-component system LytT family response regulator